MATTTKPTVQDQVNVITLKCAQEWHKAFKDQNKKGFAIGDIPHSIVIPFADIEQIVNDFRKSINETVNGMRIYFIIKPGGKANGRPNISCICVPTKGPRASESDPPTYTDMVVNATLKAGAPRNPHCPGGNADSSRNARLAAVDDETDDNYVSVYDVTRPCPPYCDPESPINDGE